VMLTIVEADRDLCKRVVNGKLLSYQKAYIYTPELEPVEDLKDLSAVLTALESEPRKAVLRSSPKEMAPGRRLGKRFNQTPQPWLCLDFDAPAPQECPDYVQEPEKALDWMIDHKWPFLDGVGIHWQLGNSAGVVPAATKMSWHLWVWLDEPVAKCSRWLQEHGFDRSMTNPVQIHYTASPIGVELPQRSGYRPGAPLSGVTEDPPPTRSGVKFAKGFVCDDETEMSMAAELASLEDSGAGRHDTIRKWIVRAVTVAYPRTHEDATRWLVEQGREYEVAESEVARLAAWAQTGLESGELEPDITLRPDLGFDDEEEVPLAQEDAKKQEVALKCDSVVESLRQYNGDKFDWLRDNIERVAGLDSITLGQLKNTWGTGVQSLNRAVKEYKTGGGEDEALDWEEVASGLVEQRPTPLIYVDDEWYSWNRRYYELVEDIKIKKEVSAVIPKPTTSRVANAYQQLQFMCHRDNHGEPVGTPFKNGRLMPDGSLVPHTPENSGRYCLAFDYDPTATCLMWERCLREWFNDDERPFILRQWLNYLITGREDAQKIMLFMGTQRGGKGTILGVMQDLIGHDNYSTPSMANFASEFGLESSLGKRAMFISDAHLPARDRSTILDRLKGISGKDRIDVNRKNRTQLKGVRLGQIIIACNEMGDIQDESNALIDRYSIIQFTKSFLGKEDPNLGAKIRKELSGIFNWALQCPPYVRFHEDGRGAGAKEDMTLSSNPVRAWAKGACYEDPTGEVRTGALFNSFNSWCDENAVAKRMAKNAFIRKLRSVFPETEVGVQWEGPARHKTLKGLSEGVKGESQPDEAGEACF